MAAVRPLFLLLFFFFRLSLSAAASEAQALLQLKTSFAQADDALSSWLPNSSPCHSKWAGVMCFDGIITGLHLTGMGLSGKIDISALLDIRGLRTISFMNNSFAGPMPDFNRLGALKSLLLSGNDFSAEIPKDFFSHLNSLKKVWLNGNNFTGRIPDSLAELTHLIELHLENNQFTGPIPAFKKPINSLDLSGNKLEGPIPASLSNYNASAFAGNDGLCGKPLDKACTAIPNAVGSAVSEDHQEEDGGGSSSNSSQVVVGVVIGLLVVFIMVVFLKSKRGRDDDFSQLEKEYVEEVVEVHVPSATTRSRTMESSSRGKNSETGSRKGSHHGKSAMTDLIMVNDEKGPFGLPDLMKAAAEVLGNGGLGSAYKAVMSSGLSVVVKRMRDMNKLARDGFDAEMRRFGRLRHTNILTPLAYHYRREEKLLVSEYMPIGSLLYVLHGTTLIGE